MATERLNVILSLASGQYNARARTAAASTAGIGTAAENTTTKFGALKQRFGGVATAAAVGLGITAVAGVAKFAKSTVTAASNLEESINAVQVVFGDAADGILAIGENSVDSFGLSQRAFNEFAVRFSAFAEQIADESGRDVVDVVEEMTTRIADFASVHNISLERAAQVAISTLAGETEVFRRFGGDVSAAAVEAEGLASGIVGVGEEMTESEKIIARYNLFMEQTEETAGDFANTSDTAANRQRKLTGRLEETQAEIGERLLPVWVELLETSEEFLPVLGDIAIKIADVITQLGPLIELVAELTGEMAGLSVEVDELGKSDGIIGTFAGAIDDSIVSLDEFGASGSSASDELVVFEGVADDAKTQLGNLERASGSSADEVEVLRQNTRGAGFALDRTKTAAQRTAEALGNYETSIRRLADPIFQVFDDQRRLAQAQERYNETVAEFGEGSPQAVDALFDVAEAQLAADDSLAGLPEGMASLAGTLGSVAERAGGAAADVRGLESALRALDGQSASVFINVIGGERIPTDPRFGITLRQHGGPLRADQPAIVGEAGPELFVPHTSGTILSNEVTNNLGNTINVTTNTVAVGRRLAEEIGQQVGLEVRLA